MSLVNLSNFFSVTKKTVKSVYLDWLFYFSFTRRSLKMKWSQNRLTSMTMNHKFFHQLKSSSIWPLPIGTEKTWLGFSSVLLFRWPNGKKFARIEANPIKHKSCVLQNEFLFVGWHPLTTFDCTAIISGWHNTCGTTITKIGYRQLVKPV